MADSHVEEIEHLLKEVEVLEGRVSALVGQVEKKESDIEDLIATRLLNLNKYYAQAQEYEQIEDIDRAVAEYNRVLALNPYEKDCHYSLGYLYYKQNNLSLALYHWKAFVEIDPNSKEAEQIKELIETLEKEPL